MDPVSEPSQGYYEGEKVKFILNAQIVSVPGILNVVYRINWVKSH